MTARCLWCECELEAQTQRRGSPQRFCDAGCRAAFHKAARQWAVREIEAGRVTVAEIKMAAGKAYTLRPSPTRPDRLPHQPIGRRAS